MGSAAIGDQPHPDANDARVATGPSPPEHVVPLSLGGSNNPDTLVSAFWTCQFQKGQCTLEELWLHDPRDRVPVSGEWDGLESMFGPLRR